MKLSRLLVLSILIGWTFLSGKKRNPKSTVQKPDPIEPLSDRTIGNGDKKPPPPLRTQHLPPVDTQGEKQYRLERKRFYVEILTLIAAVYLAWIAYGQWTEMEKSTKAAISAAKTATDALKESRDNFQQDQRPYVWLSERKLPEPDFFPSYSQVTWNWYMKNYGKTPALGMRYVQRIKIGDGPYKYTYGLKGGRAIAAPMPPNREDFSTVVSEPGITQDEFKRLLTVSGSISIWIILNYADSYGGKYETSFCLERLAIGAISYCTDKNYIR